MLFVLAMKFLLLCLLIFKFGFVYGIALMIIGVIAYHKIIEILFGLISIRGLDKVFITHNPIGRYQVIAMLKFDNFNKEKIKTFFIEKLIKKIPKLRYKLTYQLFDFYYKEVSDINEISNKVMIKEKLDNEQELFNYISKEVNKQIDIFTEIPYEIHIMEVASKGVALIKYDHVLSDALGIVSALCMIADNFSVEMYPKLMRNAKEPKWYQLIYLYIVFPFFYIYTNIVLYSHKEAKNPFRAITKPISSNTKMLLSKTFMLKDFEAYRKENKVSFNDIMMTAFSISIKSILQNKNKFIVDLPVGNTVIPKNINSVAITNHASGILLNLPLIDNVNQMKQITKCIRKSVKPEILFSSSVGADLLSEWTTMSILEKYSYKFASTFDFLFTNVPGPSMKIVYGDSICEDMMIFPSCGYGMPFVTVFSFNGQFKFVISYNENSEIDCVELLKKFETVLSTSFII